LRHSKSSATDSQAAQRQFGYGIRLGVAVDFLIAAHYLTLAAYQNCPAAQLHDGDCRCLVSGLPVDLIGGGRYLQRAADQNMAEAQFKYVKCLEQGVRIDLLSAARDHKLATDQNLGQAQFE
jgi:TPR repeat protein